jgi:hypothetical protein
VLDVVAVQEASVGAAWKAAPSVAQGQRAAYCGRNRTRAAADVQPRTVASDGHKAAVAGDAAERFRGNAAPVIQRGTDDAIGRQGILIHVNHDLEALATAAGCGVASQETLGQGHHAVRARRPGRSRR